MPEIPSSLEHSPPSSDQPPPDWVSIAQYPSFVSADEHALVLLATGFDCWLHPRDDCFHLSVPNSSATAALAEIQAYQQELPAEAVIQEPPVPPAKRDGAGILVIWSLLLVTTFIFQQSDPSLTEHWLSSTSGITQRGEWWRPFTALFLHADIAHLAGNLFGGSLFGLLLVRSVGPWPAIIGTLLGGTLGNLANALLHQPHDHRSIGASTAVFAALGMLSACGFFELLQHRRSLPWRRIIAPVLAGTIILGWMGGGSIDGTVDVAAHVAGFCCGLLIGSLHQLLTTHQHTVHTYQKA